MPEEAIAQVEAENGAVDFEVWPENWEALCAFLAVSTQWRTSPIGGGMEPMRLYWLGLDYAAVGARLDIAPGAALWGDLAVMEAAARNVLNGLLDAD